jgi:ketosteroid isomerase-like protein
MNNLKSRLGSACAVVSAIVLVGLSAVVAGPKSIATPYADDEAAVRAALLKFAVSFEQNDIGMASQVWANDESLIVFESGNSNYGWKDYRDRHLVPAMGSMKNTKVGFTDIKIHLAGKTAWATFKYTISADGPDRGKTGRVDFSGIATTVLEQRDGRWQIVHWHSSASRRTTP